MWTEKEREKERGPASSFIVQPWPHTPKGAGMEIDPQSQSPGQLSPTLCNRQLRLPRKIENRVYSATVSHHLNFALFFGRRNLPYFFNFLIKNLSKLIYLVKHRLIGPATTSLSSVSSVAVAWATTSLPSFLFLPSLPPSLRLASSLEQAHRLVKQRQ